MGGKMGGGKQRQRDRQADTERSRQRDGQTGKERERILGTGMLGEYGGDLQEVNEVDMIMFLLQCMQLLKIRRHLEKQGEQNGKEGQ